MTRSEYESYILTSVAAVMSKEQHKEFGGFLHSLSDVEFKSFVAEMGEKHGSTSLKEVMDLQQELQHSRNTLSCGYDNIPVFFLGEEENAAILESISHSRPANLILLDRDSDREIINLWRGKNENLTGIPSDLFFSGNIPLIDCRISIDHGNEVIKFRFVIYPDYAERIALSDENNSAQVGAVILDFAMGQLIQEIEVLKGHDWMMMNAAMGYRRIPKDLRDVISAKSTVSDFAGIFSELTATWYGIQIALLHPIVKDVFQSPKTVIDETSERKIKKNGRKRPLRYIKKHIINAGDFTEKLHGNRSFQRHTLVWYVIGHWRSYSNGKKVFIKPYWKGALRETKSANAREREIVLEERK